MAHHTRNLRLTPPENQVLRVLEEAGEETLAAVVNTLLGEGQINSDINCLTVVEKAIRELRKMGLIELQREYAEITPRFVYVPDEERLPSLAEMLFWDEDHGRWIWNSKEAGAHLHVLLTRKGQDALTR